MKIRLTGDQAEDIKAANLIESGHKSYPDWKNAGFSEPHTWHHDYRRGVMQLVPWSVHKPAFHYGGNYFWYSYRPNGGKPW